ncbi:MAG: hypothetical protein ACAI35_22305 [Candidatus Methylacidiphilales bacterium]
MTPRLLSATVGSMVSPDAPSSKSRIARGVAPLLSAAVRCWPGPVPFVLLFATLMLSALPPDHVRAQDVPGGPGMGSAAGDEVLVPGNFQPREDSFGFQWDISNFGTVTNGSGDCFDNAAQLFVNGSPFNFSSVLMTPDGKEFVIIGNAGNFRVMRRIRFDEKLGMMRYYEVIESKDRNDFNINLTLQTKFGSRWDKVLTSSGLDLTKGLERGDSGIAVVAPRTRTSALWLVSGPRRRIKPEIVLTNNIAAEVKFTLPLRAGGQVAVLHYIGQRSRLKQEDVRTMFAAWLGRGTAPATDMIPLQYRRVVSNFPPSMLGATALAPAGPLLTRLEALMSENWQLERGPDDIVVLNADTKLAGKLTGGRGELTTTWGKVSFPLEEVAGIVGGGGLGKMPTVFFRDGEVLSGTLAFRDLKLALTTGANANAPWSLDVNPDQVLAVLTRKDPALEGKPMPGVVAFAELATQDRLGLVDPSATLELNCAWGPLKVQLADIDTLGAVREPQFGFRLVLRDKTSLLVFPKTGDVELKTARAGTMKLAPQMLLKLSSFQPTAAADPNEGDEGGGNVLLNGAPGSGPGISGSDQAKPTFQLIGENVICGTLAADKLELLTVSGPRSLPSAQISLIERPMDDTSTGSATSQNFVVQMQDGSKWTGRLKEPSLSVRFGAHGSGTGTVLQIPIEHFMSYQIPEQPGAIPRGDGSAPDGSVLMRGSGTELRSGSPGSGTSGRGELPSMEELPANPIPEGP